MVIKNTCKDVNTDYNIILYYAYCILYKLKVYVRKPNVKYRFTIASIVLFNIYSMSREISGN